MPSDRSITAAGEVIADRGDLAVVVGGGERLGEESIALFGACGEFVEVGDIHGVARGEFQNVVAGEFQDVGCGRHVFVAASGDFDVVDSDGLAAIFEEFEIEIAKLASGHRECPAVFFLFDFGRWERG